MCMVIALSDVIACRDAVYTNETELIVDHEDGRYAPRTIGGGSLAAGHSMLDTNGRRYNIEDTVHTCVMRLSEGSIIYALGEHVSASDITSRVRVPPASVLIRQQPDCICDSQQSDRISYRRMSYGRPVIPCMRVCRIRSNEHQSMDYALGEGCHSAARER
jgi:hypothetical protein